MTEALARSRLRATATLLSVVIAMAILGAEAHATDYCVQAGRWFGSTSGYSGNTSPPAAGGCTSCIGNCGEGTDRLLLSFTLDACTTSFDQVHLRAVGDSPGTGNLLPVLDAGVIEDGGISPSHMALYSEDERYGTYTEGVFFFDGSPLGQGDRIATLVVFFPSGLLESLGWQWQFGLHPTDGSNTAYCGGSLEPCSPTPVQPVTWGAIKTLFR